MEWRCEWCGKPHAENDPPCDNCGHGSFEEAIVQQPAGGPGGESTTVWVCTECGREHAKHAPPCSRCGNATLERRETTVADEELEAPGYLDLLTPRYVLGFAVAIGLGVLLILGLAGVIDLPGMDSGVPEVEDVPGDAEAYEDTSLSAVESSYVDRVNQARADTGQTELSRDDHLDDVARFFNQRRVKASLGAGTLPSDERMGELLSESCDASIYLRVVDVDPAGSDPSADDLGSSLAERRIEEYGVGESVAGGITGVDVHAGPNDRLYATEFVC